MVITEMCSILYYFGSMGQGMTPFTNASLYVKDTCLGIKFVLFGRKGWTKQNTEKSTGRLALTMPRIDDV